MVIRCLIDPPLPGSWNMAVDEAILQHAEQTRQATLRFYRWSRPTLSLGYFQSYADRLSHPASLPCEAVRRSTGGGAIVHDREITYSFVCPLSLIASPTDGSFGSPTGAMQQRRHGRSLRSAELYRVFHETLVAELADRGVFAQLWSGSREETFNDRFLCFQRRTSGDVVMGRTPQRICQPTDHNTATVKIAGSAQRKRRDLVLQHGSVLLERSAWAPELIGIRELCAGATDCFGNYSGKFPTDFGGFIPRLIEGWQSEVAARLQARLAPGELSEKETSLAHTLETTRFRQPLWNGKR